MNKIQSDLHILAIANQKQQTCITSLYLNCRVCRMVWTSRQQVGLRDKLIVNICKFLPLKQLLNLRLVNKSFYNRINCGIPLLIQMRKEQIENIQSQKYQVDDTKIKQDISDLKQTLNQFTSVNELRAIRCPYPLVMELLQKTTHLLTNKEMNNWGQIASSLQTIQEDLLNLDILLLSSEQVKLFQDYVKTPTDFNKYSIFCGQLFQFLLRLNDIMNSNDYIKCLEEKEKENQILKLQREIDLFIKIITK